MGMRNTKGQFLKGNHWRAHQPFRDKAWLVKHYCEDEISTGEIGKMFGVTDAAILFWLRRNGIKRRTVLEARKIKHWGNMGVDNPMWGKCGELNPRWQGGITPLRQAFYISQEWKKVCSATWERDKAKCQRCGLKCNTDMPFHIHHIVSFKDAELRAKLSNLVLVCEACHHFIHSKRNKTNEFIQKK